MDNTRSAHPSPAGSGSEPSTNTAVALWAQAANRRVAKLIITGLMSTPM